jgi:hypothetical protein
MTNAASPQKRERAERRAAPKPALPTYPSDEGLS